MGQTADPAGQFPTLNLFRALFGRDNMRTIQRYPIFPSPLMHVQVPVGAVLLEVTLEQNTYYLHALVDLDVMITEPRGIVAHLEGSTIEHGAKLGTYLGGGQQVGTWQRWHFFDFGSAQ